MTDNHESRRAEAAIVALVYLLCGAGAVIVALVARVM